LRDRESDGGVEEVNVVPEREKWLKEMNCGFSHLSSCSIIYNMSCVRSLLCPPLIIKCTCHLIILPYLVT
jgi:hypothetical protein